MQAVKWVVAKLQGDKAASFCRKMSGREVPGRYISITVFHVTLLPMDFWTPSRVLRNGCRRNMVRNKTWGPPKQKNKEEKEEEEEEEEDLNLSFLCVYSRRNY